MINLIQPFPFFDRLTEQVRFKENCDGNYKFLSNSTNLIPFQIVLPTDAISIESVKIKGFSCAYELEMTDNTEKIYIKTTGLKKWVIYKGDQLTFTRESGVTAPLVLSSDYYHFEVTVDGKTFYSEMFHVIGDGICSEPITMEIQAWHNSDAFGYSFSDGFKFRTFFNAFITNTEAATVDEFNKDGYERQILLRRVISFTRNIELNPMPNTCAIGMIALSGLKNIRIIENGNTYVVKDITIKQEKVEGGALDSILIGFSIFDEDIVSKNCNS